MSIPDPRDEVPFQTMLALWAFRSIAAQAEGAPKELMLMADATLKTHAQHIPASLRFEAKRVGEELGMRLLESVLTAYAESWQDAMRRSKFPARVRYEDIGSAVLPKQAKEHKRLWKSAIKSGSLIEMSYVSATSGLTKRVVQPQGVESDSGVGHCFLRDDDRVFRFDRMFDVKVVSITELPKKELRTKK